MLSLSLWGYILSHYLYNCPNCYIGDYMVNLTDLHMYFNTLSWTSYITDCPVYVREGRRHRTPYHPNYTQGPRATSTNDKKWCTSSTKIDMFASKWSPMWPLQVIQAPGHMFTPQNDKFPNHCRSLLINAQLAYFSDLDLYSEKENWKFLEV